MSCQRFYGIVIVLTAVFMCYILNFSMKQQEMMGAQLRALRKLLHLSQAEFGEKLGVSRDVIGNMEYGRVRPKEVFLNHLCDVYNVNRAWLLDGTGGPFRSDIRLHSDLNEAISLFCSLTPALQDYALQQLRALLQLQSQMAPRS